MTTAITSVNSSTTSQLLLAADATRTSVTLENTDANTLYVALGQAATTSIGGYTFSRNYGASATLTPPESYQAIYAIWSADGASTVAAEFDEYNQNCSVFGGRVGGIGKGFLIVQPEDLKSILPPH